MHKQRTCRVGHSCGSGCISAVRLWHVFYRTGHGDRLGCKHARCPRALCLPFVAEGDLVGPQAAPPSMERFECS